MVYLVRSSEATDAYDSWLCGGALVSTSQILTSAACIMEIDNIFAIAGYRKYVNGRDINRDNCTRLKKQRVVKIRVPREHVIHVSNYTNTTQWMTIDIGVATVEKPYDFQDVTFRIYCSYIPTAIEINFNTKLDQTIDTNVVALGWGRARGSKTRDLVDRNSETLREVSTKIKPKEDCVKKFRGNGLANVIEKHMICTHGRGLLDAEGLFIQETDKTHFNKCSDFQKQNFDIFEASDCIENEQEFKLAITRKTVRTIHRNNTRMLHNSGERDTKKLENYTRFNLPIVKGTRRQGICQNDHGGPLITWLGKTELLIGVAVNSLYDEQYNCIGPYLFTSTAAAGQIVRCLLANEQSTRKSCLGEEHKNYDIVETLVDVAPKEIPKERATVSEENVSSIEVYLLNSPYSDNQPDSWLCGGVLISTTQVLTAAACLTDVTHIYVIAGYKKYVNGANIMKDECTRTRKQKIIRIIIPRAYSTTIWIKFDIGLGIVEKPYDFSDVSYRTVCSYVPGSISINYDINMEAVNTTAVALGWGGAIARQPGVEKDINSEYLMEEKTIITNISLCQAQFPNTVEYYFLCAYGTRNMTSHPQDEIQNFDDCDTRRYSLNDSTNLEVQYKICFADGELPSRRTFNRSDSSHKDVHNRNKTHDKNHTLNRRQNTDIETNIAGICQNDHGGPLVVLAGKTEKVIGVALNSVYDYNYKCEGPSLYLSTARSSVIIKCLLSTTSESRSLCKTINNEIKEYSVTWPTENRREESMFIADDLLGLQQVYVQEHPRTLVRLRPQLRLRDT